MENSPSLEMIFEQPTSSSICSNYFDKMCQYLSISTPIFDTNSHFTYSISHTFSIYQPPSSALRSPATFAISKRHSVSTEIADFEPTCQLSSCITSAPYQDRSMP